MTQQTLGETALGYKPEAMGNVADLPSISKHSMISEGEGIDQKTGKPYVYKYIESNGNKYRIANPVLEKIKTILELKPEVTNFKVTKTGSGVATKYEVTALQ